MRTLLGSIGAVICVLVLGVGAASAAVDVELLIENITTHTTGVNVAARPGDIVRLTLTLSNLTKQKTQADVTVVGRIPGTTVRVTESTKLNAGQTRRHTEQAKVPAGVLGPLTIDVSAIDGIGASDSATGTLSFGAAKTGETGVAPSPFQRLFLEMLARGLVHAFLTDDGATSTSFSAIKELYR
jgi:hypothetical protein